MISITDDYNFDSVTTFIDNISCDIDVSELNKLEQDLYNLD